MKRTDGNTVVSDSGHTCIIRYPNSESWGVMQHSIAARWLTIEDLQMNANPEKFWRENKVEDLPIRR